MQELARLYLTSILKERDMTQSKLSDLSGLSKNSIGKLCRSPESIKLTTIAKLCSALNITPNDLFLEPSSSASLPDD